MRKNLDGTERFLRSNRLTILIAADYSADYSGNFIASLAALSQELAKRNYEVMFLFPSKAKSHSWKSILSEYCIIWGDLKGYKLLATLLKIRRKYGKSITVYTHFFGAGQLLMTELVYSDVIDHFHMTVKEYKGIRGKIGKTIKHLILDRCTNIAVSPAVLNDLHDVLGLNIEKCALVNNAIDFSRLGKAAPSKEGGFNDLNNRDSVFKIGIFGSDFYRKGVDVAIRAVNSLGDSFQLVVLVHDFDATRKECDKLHINYENIIFRPVCENVESFYQAIDLFISPSRSEAFGYAVVEAAWSPCQVAASNVPGQNCLQVIPETIWFEADNPDDLKRAILIAEMRKTSGDINQINQTQRSFVEAKFSMENWVKRVMDVIINASNHAPRDVAGVSNG